MRNKVLIRTGTGSIQERDWTIGPVCLERRASSGDPTTQVRKRVSSQSGCANTESAYSVLAMRLFCGRAI